MDEFILIKAMNEAMLKLKKEKNEDTLLNEKIKELLEDEAFFFKANKENVFKVLNNCGVTTEKLDETYKKLTSRNKYEELFKKGKINKEDVLTVSYNN